MLSVRSLPGALWCPWEGRAKVCADIIRTTFIMSAVGSPRAHTGSTDSLCAYFALCSAFQLKKHIGGWCWFPFFILQFSDPVVLSKQYELCPLTLTAPSEIPQYFLLIRATLSGYCIFFANLVLRRDLWILFQYSVVWNSFFGISIDFAEWQDVYWESE